EGRPRLLELRLDRRRCVRSQLLAFDAGLLVIRAQLVGDVLRIWNGMGGPAFHPELQSECAGYGNTGGDVRSALADTLSSIPTHIRTSTSGNNFRFSAST